MNKDDKAPYCVVLEDDLLITKVVESSLMIDVRSFVTGHDLLSELKRLAPVAVFVDVHLGPTSGIDFIPALREEWPVTPIIVMTADSSEDLVADALASGADDFVYKPIKPKELLARFQARMKEHARYILQAQKTIGDLRIDFIHGALAGRGVERYLSRSEIDILRCIIEAGGTVVSRQALKLRFWGNIRVSDKALDRRIHIIRKTLSDVSDDVEIISVYGAGFKITCAARDDSLGGHDEKDC